jgi:hypothetical protein
MLVNDHRSFLRPVFLRCGSSRPRDSEHRIDIKIVSLVEMLLDGIPIVCHQLNKGLEFVSLFNERLLQSLLRLGRSSVQ